MKTNLLFLLMSGFLLANANYTNAQSDSTKIKGSVSGVWTVTKSPYFVTGDITVPANNTLEIRPGVRVLFMEHYKFNVNGLLRAIGKPDSMILFDGINPAVKWHGIRFSSAHDSCVVKYCRIQNGAAFGSSLSGGGVSIVDCSPKLSHNIIRNNQANNYGGGVYIIGRPSSPILDGNQIVNNRSLDDGGGIFINDNSSPVITNNIIAGNRADSDGDGIYIDFYSTPKIINNTIEKNHHSIQSRSESIFMWNSPSPKILNNIISGHTCGIFGTPGPNSMLDYNDVWGNNSNYCGVNRGNHDISCDPFFLKSDSNYHLQPNSPAIDNGT
ncbi:right-handed parallel beta-helix repeat-containing protein, partial [bacterium]|nr:right-handed parallel beta-helix repeat-containing protein [bacterium]